MNKNTKKFVVTLLSVLMVLSFMPAMAFAGVDGSHTFTTADDSNVEWVMKPSCELPGYGTAKCVKEDYGTSCSAVHNVFEYPLGHRRVYEDGQMKKIVVTAKEYAEYMKQAGYDQEEIDDWMEDYGTAICTGTVGVCEGCGLYMSTNPSPSYDDELSDPYSFGMYASVPPYGTRHTAPADTLGCAESFTCEVCGQKNVTNDDYFEGNAAIYHADDSNLKDGKEYIAHAIDGVGKVTVTEKVCKECNQVVDYVQNYEALDPTTTDPTKSTFTHTLKTEVVYPATCLYAGLEETYCTKCHELISYEEIPQLDHKWEKKTQAATETVKGYEYEQCSVCKYYKDENGDPTYYKANAKRTYVAPTIDHNFVVTPLLPKNCVDSTMIFVACSNPGCDAYALITEKDDVTKLGSKYYVTIDGKDIEVPFEEAEGHKWGDAKVFAEATCETKPVEGRVCETCGALYHDTLREVGQPLGHEPVVKTIEATCGTEGYTYSVCSRCDEYLNKDGKAAPGPYEWDEVPPVVGYGAECQYEWTVTKEATATETGEQALVCKVCGHVKEGSRTVIPIDADKAKQAAADEAKPVIEAASAIISDMDKYTDDSVIAIIAAEANLNQAITSGSAADVKKATAELQAAVNAAQEKAASKMTAKGKTVKVKYKKSKTFKANKAFTVKNAAGKVTYKKANKKGGAKIKVASNGKVTVKKGLKKGTYKVKVKITDAGSGTVLGKTKTVTLKVKITK